MGWTTNGLGVLFLIWAECLFFLFDITEDQPLLKGGGLYKLVKQPGTWRWILSSVFRRFEERTDVSVHSHAVFTVRCSIEHRGDMAFRSSLLYFLYFYSFHVYPVLGGKSWSTENSKGNKTVPGKVATTCKENGHKYEDALINFAST